MKKLAVIASAVYIIAVLVAVFCVPISAIMIVCKLCAATALSWIGCCIPLIIALAVSPIIAIGKIIEK